jgi:hypothetical protein
MDSHPATHPHLPCCTPRKFLATLFCITVYSAAICAQNPRADRPGNSLPVVQQLPAAEPVTVIPTYTLNDCLAIGRTHQPAIQAAQASLYAAQMSQRGLNDIGFGKNLAKDLPVRKQQAAWGVNAAYANLLQVQCDISAAIARMYFSVQYAREQAKLLEEMLKQINAAIKTGEVLLGQEGAPPDLSPQSLHKGRNIIVMIETKQDEARRGVQRAEMGLREAMGIGPDCPFAVAYEPLPEPLRQVSKEYLISLAVTRRGEVTQVDSAVNITCLEVKAQSLIKGNKKPTAAAGGDFHAKPIPSGSFGDDYKPGAIGMDFPTLFAGPQQDRMQRAGWINARTVAVAEKTRNLMALEAEDAYLKWEEAIAKMDRTAKQADEDEKFLRKLKAALEGNILQSYKDYLELVVLAGQIKAQYNEARYNHAVALTEFERVTNCGLGCGITSACSAER